MDFLKAEIERKKRQISEKNVMQPEKKYFKRGDLVAVQEKEYLAKFGCKETPVTAVEGEGAKGKGRIRSLVKSIKNVLQHFNPFCLKHRFVLVNVYFRIKKCIYSLFYLNRILPSMLTILGIVQCPRWSITRILIIKFRSGSNS